MPLSDPRLFGHDPVTGMTEYFHFDSDTGGFVIETQQDVSALIEVNKARRNATEKHTRYGELACVASTPNVIVMELAKQHIMSPAGVILDDKKYRAWLNDPENEAFRVRRGRV